MTELVLLEVDVNSMEDFVWRCLQATCQDDIVDLRGEGELLLAQCSRARFVMGSAPARNARAWRGVWMITRENEERLVDTPGDWSFHGWGC